MKAVRFHAHGGPDVLRLEEVPEPGAGPGEAFVRVRACALNHLDLWQRRGIERVTIPFPHISGADVAGEVPEINSLQTAVRRVAHEYLNEAEDYGYSPDICGYVKADVAAQLRGGELPMGRIPKPSIAVYTNACNTYIKWAEIWERMYRIPVVTIDVPGTRADGTQTWPGDPDFENDRRYVEGQLRELIPVLEQVSGVKFDIDRLREAMGHANTLGRGWKRVLELNRSRPAVFNALTDGTIYLGVANDFRGAPEGARYFTELGEEMAYKAAHGIGTLTEEQYLGMPEVPAVLLGH